MGALSLVNALNAYPQPDHVAKTLISGSLVLCRKAIDLYDCSVWSEWNDDENTLVWEYPWENVFHNEFTHWLIALQPPANANDLLDGEYDFIQLSAKNWEVGL